MTATSSSPISVMAMLERYEGGVATSAELAALIDRTIPEVHKILSAARRRRERREQGGE